jgi:hypothetical protein
MPPSLVWSLTHVLRPSPRAPYMIPTHHSMFHSFEGGPVSDIFLSQPINLLLLGIEPETLESY